MRDIKIIFLGDFLLNSSHFPTVSDSLQEKFYKSDIVSINLEGPVVVNKKNIPVSKIGPLVCQHPSAITGLKVLGVNLFALANNHIMDFGVEGLRDTINILGSNNCIGAGFDEESAYKGVVKQINDCRIGFLAFSEAQFGVYKDGSLLKIAGGYAWAGSSIARASIQKLKQEVDYLFVQVHAGLEMVDIPLPEWRTIYKEFIDLGADLVVGHHPHVLQGSEVYQGKQIYYSIGDFYMDIVGDSYKKTSGGYLNIVISEKGMCSNLVPIEIRENLITENLEVQTIEKIEMLSAKLHDEIAYKLEIEKISITYWQDYYKKYFMVALLCLKNNWIKRIKDFLKKRSSERYAGLMLIHNSQIESHRWTIDRAIRALFKIDNLDDPS